MDIDLDDFTNEEKAYRRGFCHGYLAAHRNPDLTQNEVYEWRHGKEKTAPPRIGIFGNAIAWPY